MMNSLVNAPRLGGPAPSAPILLTTLYLGEAWYAFDAASVQEVIRLGRVTPVPHAPPEVLGVLNLRGKIVTLLDTGILLGAGPTRPNSESRVVLLDSGGESVGLLVDRVGEVIEAVTDDLEALPLSVAPAQKRLLDGVLRAGGRVLSLLRTTELLAGPRGPSGARSH